MPEYISREAAIVKATKVLADDFDAYNVKVSLQAIPSADVAERKSARWKGAGLGDYYCSLCNEAYSIGSERVKNWHYCPNCGAKMDGGRDDV